MLATRKYGVTTLVLFIALLTGCSGGGGGGAVAPAGPVTSTLSFPLQSAYKTLTANGMTKSFTVSGDCSGSGSIAIAPAATAATFEGVAALSADGTATWSYSNCTPASNAQTYTAYFDSNYIPLGSKSIGSYYGVYLTPPTLPASVIVGGTGVIGTETLYTNSTKTRYDGYEVQSYVIEADTATTAIVNLITKSYNVGAWSALELTQTVQDRYRIDAVGALTPISTDIQLANGSTMHLVFTYN